MISASTGGAYAGTVTVYITIDGGSQTIGSVGSGICTNEGNGFYTYLPTAAECDGYFIAFTFIGSGAIPTTIQYATVTEAQMAAITAASSPATITVADLITAAMRRINALQENEQPTAAALEDGFQRLNDLMESWQTERLTIPYILRTTWTISSTKGTLASPYTVGSGGDIDVARPTFIDDIRYQDTSLSPTYEYPLVSLTDKEWQAIPQKNLTSPLPVYAYYNPTYANYLGSLYLWMVPTSATLQGVLYAPAQVAGFGSTATTIILPPGYQRFMRDNLAVELQPEFLQNVPIDPSLRASAIESKANIKRRNTRSNDMLTPTFSRGIYSINADVNF